MQTIIIFATLYPAYSSFKAIKNKDIKEYSRWMMYWIVFAIFSFVEIFADIVISFWLPFYYEIKILFVLWLMSPYANGARIVYKHLIHPELNKREHLIDNYITYAKELGITSIWHLWKQFSGFINKMLLQFIQVTQAALFYHIHKTTQIQSQSQQMVVLPNIFRFMMSPNVPSQSVNDQIVYHTVHQDLPFMRNPRYRWFSEENLNIAELDNKLINTSVNLPFRSESESNLDDWEKMDIIEVSQETTPNKPLIKTQLPKPKSKKPKTRKVEESASTESPYRRTTRAAAVKARVKCITQTTNEEY